MASGLPLAAIALFALTRAEIIERMKAPAITKTSGLVQVIADCRPDIRREFQMPIAASAADICEQLYRGANLRPRQFNEPGLRIVLGDNTNGVTNVTVRVRRRENGSPVTRIRLECPWGADLERFRLETIKGFARAVLTNELDDAAAVRLIRSSDPLLRAMDRYEELSRWMRGEKVEGGDEKFLALRRSVLVPGMASEMDVLLFASRLRLYPESYGASFPKGATELTFREAIAVKDDEDVRRQAQEKAVEIAAFGMGHGEEMTKAVRMYQLFLLGLASGKISADELDKLLQLADAKLETLITQPGKEVEDEKKRN